MSAQGSCYVKYIRAKESKWNIFEFKKAKWCDGQFQSHSNVAACIRTKVCNENFCGLRQRFFEKSFAPAPRREHTAECGQSQNELEYNKWLTKGAKSCCQHMDEHEALERLHSPHSSILFSFFVPPFFLGYKFDRVFVCQKCAWGRCCGQQLNKGSNSTTEPKRVKAWWGRGKGTTLKATKLKWQHLSPTDVQAHKKRSSKGKKANIIKSKWECLIWVYTTAWYTLGQQQNLKAYINL